MTVYLPVETYAAQKPGSLLWCDAAMSLQFTQVRYFPCKTCKRIVLLLVFIA